MVGSEVNNLLLMLSGARREILDWYPEERPSFQALGLAILITSEAPPQTIEVGGSADVIVRAGSSS